MVKFYEGVYRGLEIYVVSLAWWHAVPSSPDGKIATNSRRQSRMQIAKSADREIDLPELQDEFLFLVEYLFEIGPTSSSGDGQLPITWSDLNAWQWAVGVSLPPWQLRLLRKLSADYLIQIRAATDIDAPQPWKVEVAPVRRAKVASHVKGLLRS